MDTLDKQFDKWIKNSLNTELALTKQHRQSAWEQIHTKASYAQLSDLIDEDFIRITSPVTAQEPLHNRIWQWISYFIAYDNTYQRAHNNSVHYYKAKPYYSGGLTLHGLEMMRHQWTYSV